MKEGQDKIYYVTADTLDGARSSPHLEIFRKKGIEVLLLADRVDEWMLSFLHEFDGKPLASVAKGGLDLGAFADEQEKAEQQKTEDEYKELVERVKAALGERVKDVRVTFRLTDSAACLVSDENEMSGHLQRLLKAAGQKAPESRPILELNPTHPLVARLKAGRGGPGGLGAAAVRPGAAGRRRPAGRPGGLRPAREPAAAGCRHAVASRRPAAAALPWPVPRPCGDSRRSSMRASSG